MSFHRNPLRSEFTFSLIDSNENENDQEFSNPFLGLYSGLGLVLGLGDGMGMGEARNLGSLSPSKTFPGLSPGRRDRRSRRSVDPKEIVAWRAVSWKAASGTGKGNDNSKDESSSIQGQCSEMGTSADGDDDVLAEEMGRSSTGGGGKRQRRE